MATARGDHDDDARVQGHVSRPPGSVVCGDNDDAGLSNSAVSTVVGMATTAVITTTTLREGRHRQDRRALKLTAVVHDRRVFECGHHCRHPPWRAQPHADRRALELGRLDGRGHGDVGGDHDDDARVQGHRQDRRAFELGRGHEPLDGRSWRSVRWLGIGGDHDARRLGRLDVVGMATSAVITTTTLESKGVIKTAGLSSSASWSRRDGPRNSGRLDGRAAWRRRR